MKKFAWITDSTCGLSEEFIKENNIFVVPLSVILNDKVYKEDIDISKEQFYDRLRESGIDAKTSQPALGNFIELYNYLKEKYDCGIAIHASSQLTGTYNSSIQASNQTAFPVEVIDSKIGAYALGKMIKNGIELVKKGKTYKEIVDVLKGYPKQTEMYLLPANFEQLRRSGRVSTSKAVFASLLKINLLLRFQEGKVIIEDKIRTKRKAKERLFQIIKDAIDQHALKEICILHAGVKEKAVAWKEDLEKIHQNVSIKTEVLVPVAGVHTGYGTMAVSWLRE